MKRIAVIGGGIGGLCAAGELAKAGHAVELFEGAATLGGKAQVVSAGGVVLDTGPTLLTMPDTVRATFERLGGVDLLPPLHRLELQTRYLAADGAVFDCWENLERTVEAARAVDPLEAEGLRGFYAAAERIHREAGLPYLESPFGSTAQFMLRVLRSGGLAAVLSGLKLSTLDALARAHFSTPFFQAFVGRFATYTGASPYEASAAFAMIPHIERAYGTHHVEGGMGKLVGALEQAVRRQGVTIHTDAWAQWEPRGTGFLAGPKGHQRPFDSVILNTDPLAQVGRAGEPLSMSGYVFHLKVGRRLKVPHHLVLFGGDYQREFAELFSGQVPSDPTVYVCHPAASDETVAPPGSSGLFVMVNVPAFTDQAKAEREWVTAGPRLRELCRQKLDRHLPGLAGASVELIGERTPLDLARTGAPGGSIYGFLPHGKFGPFRRPSLRSSTPGVFFAGGGTHPGGGVPMVMLSGHFAAGLARAHVEAGR